MQKKIIVPYISQMPDGGYCGVGALNMIVRFYGVKIPQKKLLKYFDNYEKIKEEGAYLSEIADAAKKLGFSAKELKGLHLDDLINYIDKNLPIITNCKHPQSVESYHAYVVKGYNDETERIYVNDPAEINKKFFTFEKFREIWEQDPHGGSLVIRPKHKFKLLNLFLP